MYFWCASVQSAPIELPVALRLAEEIRSRAPARPTSPANDSMGLRLAQQIEGGIEPRVQAAVLSGLFQSIENHSVASLMTVCSKNRPLFPEKVPRLFGIANQSEKSVLVQRAA